MKNLNNKLVFGKQSIIELNDSETFKIFGGTSLIIVTENTIRSIQIPIVNYSTNTLCTSDVK